MGSLRKLALLSCLLLPACGSDARDLAGNYAPDRKVPPKGGERGQSPGSVADRAKPDVRSTRSEPIVWADAPSAPARISSSSRPRIVLLSAPWCQWCRVLEHDVLPDPRIAEEVVPHFTAMHVDVDVAPLWMDIPGFTGLPTFAFFDRAGRHVLTRSGYRPAAELALQIRAVRQALERGELEPYPRPPPGRSLPTEPLDPTVAAAELVRLEGEIFMQVNSNTGGFHTPARHPYPALLAELERWRALGAPPRVGEWVRLTVRHALMGSSPRLRGEPLPDMEFGALELAELVRRGPDDPRWRQGVEHLPDWDPYRGLQDPVDHGVFRYSAGPGWYHPHFERRALDNLAWVDLLRQLGRRREASQIEEFVLETFAGEVDLLGASQRSDPFYYRLGAGERQGLAPPPVAPSWRLDVHSRAARLIPRRCGWLDRVATDRWPRMGWTETGEDESSGEAPPDAVGELLLALAQCRGEQRRARALGRFVATWWEERPIPATGRLFRLSAGICAALPQRCGHALAAVSGLDLDLDHPPPLAAFARLARALPQ